MNSSAAFSQVESAPLNHSGLLAGLREQIDARLAELLPPPNQASDLMGAALHEGVLAPGKRIRPLLMLLVGRSLGQSSAALLDLACAVEMVHAASLFLDDMPCMDNARIRRGRPTVHARYGEDVAVLGAVALVTQACAIAASAPGLNGELRAELVRVLCHAMGLQGLVRGQYRDLREGAAERHWEDIYSTNQQKTGSLFSAGFEMAALAAGAGDTTRCALRAAALELGQAFQLRDDIEDSHKTPAAPGKDRNKDAGKSTLVALLGLEAAERRLAGHLAEAQSQLRTALPDDEALVAWVSSAFAMPPQSRKRVVDAGREVHGGLVPRTPRADTVPAPLYGSAAQGPRPQA